MKRLADLLADLVPAGDIPAVMVGGLGMDSRRVVPGDAFVAVEGTRTHGMEFAAAALAAGASVVLHDGRAEPPAGIAARTVEVPGLQGRLAELAKRFYDDPVAALDLSAVTGTNGKTSVAWLLAQALDGAMIGTLGSGRPGALREATHTTPDLPSLYRELARIRDEGIRKVVLEASSHALAQHRLDGLQFTTAVFTNLGRDHLDYHDSVEAYGRAKARLFHEFPVRRRLINIDDPFGRQLVDELVDEMAEARGDRRGLLRFGLDPARLPDAFGTIRRADLDGLQIDVTTPEGRVCCCSGLIGRVNAFNLVVVATELMARGADPDDAAEIVAALMPVPGRMNRIDGPDGQRVVIDYAHTPDALENALASLREMTPARLICVFGCGGQRDAGKRPLMGRIAEALADRVVITDDNPRRENRMRIVREIEAGMARPDRARVIPDRREAIACAVASAEPGDCVLVAGKGHEQTQDLGDRVIEFSDFDAVRDALTEAA